MAMAIILNRKKQILKKYHILITNKSYKNFFFKISNQILLEIKNENY